MIDVPDIDKMRCPTCGNFIDDTGQCVTLPMEGEPACEPIPASWSRAIERERDWEETMRESEEVAEDDLYDENGGTGP